MSDPYVCPPQLWRPSQGHSRPHPPLPRGGGYFSLGCPRGEPRTPSSLVFFRTGIKQHLLLTQCSKVTPQTGTARLPPLPLQLAGSLNLESSLLLQHLGPPTLTPPVQRLLVTVITSGLKGPTTNFSLMRPLPSPGGLAQRAGPLDEWRSCQGSGTEGLPPSCFFVVVAVVALFL